MKHQSSNAGELPPGRLFLTIPHAAPLLDADVRTLRRACQAGEIPAIKVGVIWRIPTAWIREQARRGLSGGTDATA